MKNIASRIAVATAAASLAFAPIAAQANTRAGDSGAVYSASAAQPGLGRSAEGEDLVGTSGILAIIFAAAVIAGIIIIIDDGDDDDSTQSPGAN